MDLLQIIKNIDPQKGVDISTITESVLIDGYQSALEVLVKVKALTTALDTIREALMESAINELRNEGGKDVSKYGATLNVSEAGTRWDFSKCGDVGYNAILQKEAELKAEKARRESILKLFAANNERDAVIDEDTGEEIKPIAPPQKKSTTIVKIEIQKQVKQYF